MKPLILLVALAALPAVAQDDAPPLAQSDAVKAAPVTSQVTLEAGLEQLDWDPARRGTLLLVAPNKLVLSGKTPLPPPRNGYGLPELVGYFDHQMVRFPTLTTAGPTQITELTVPPPQDDLIQDFYRNRPPHAFLVSLSPSQLQKAATEQGIGYADLEDARQRALWEKLFPQELAFRGSNSVPPGMRSGQTPWYGKETLPVLSEAAQRTLRIRLSSDLTLFPKPGNYLVSLREQASGYVRVALRTLPVAPDKLFEYQQEQAKKRTSGSGKVPYHRKLSDLDLSQERFNVPVSLNDAKTVGDVVKQAAQALGLELYADARLASQPVFIRTAPGKNVSAADALSAILRATATTIRRLQAGQSTAFVISHDRVPLGNLSVAIFDAILPREMGKMQEQLADEKGRRQAVGKLRQAKLLTTLPRGAGGSLPEKIWQAALENPVAFPLTELPSEAKARVQAYWQALQGHPGPEGTPPPAAPQSVLPRVELTVQVLCPGLGEATLASLSVKELTPQPETPLVKLPETFKMRGLRVRPPKTPAEAKQLLAQAKARGFTTLYLALSGDANDDRGVSLLATEKDTLALVPTLSPLMPAPTDTQRERDVSVTGRAAAEMAQGRPSLSAIAQIIPYIVPIFEQITRLDALVPEAVPIERFTNRVALLAALPAVSQIGLYDTASLGYVGGSEGGLETLWTGGYTTTERLAFLRTQGMDPADLSGSGQMSLPFFSDQGLIGPLQSAWNQRRKARATQLQKRLDAAFQAARITKPLLKLEGGFVLMGRQQWKTAKGGAGPANLPYWEAMMNVTRGGEGDLPDETSSIRLWLAQRLGRKAEPGDSERPDFSPGIPPTGFVYDLTDLPLAQALTHLEAIIAVKS